MTVQEKYSSAPPMFELGPPQVPTINVAELREAWRRCDAEQRHLRNQLNGVRARADQAYCSAKIAELEARAARRARPGAVVPYPERSDEAEAAQIAKGCTLFVLLLTAVNFYIAACL